jgi:hypothetical protein
LNECRREDYQEIGCTGHHKEDRQEKYGDILKSLKYIRSFKIEVLVYGDCEKILLVKRKMPNP